MSARTAYLAAAGYVAELAHELGPIERRHGRLLIAAGPPRRAAWAANVWFDPQPFAIASIGDAAAQLRAIQRNWAAYAPVFHRRAALIEQKLPKVSAKPLVFGAPPPTAPLGSWTLLNAGTMLAAPHCSSPFPHGEVRFVEDKTGPPSRAYLKLWEILTLIGRRPRPGEFCVDLGGSPGGWSWALARMGAQVLAVDKAPLDPAVARLPNVEYRAESAFALDPRVLGPVDWLFCDVVCYPARLLRLVERWLDAGTCRNFVCTIKFQGATDHAAARRFAAIPGSELRHLHHNKHELTWSKTCPGESRDPSLRHSQFSSDGMPYR
ncbi:MAG TPA: SAM-dependent methyltransferase [Stellaceae bacterium]|nr:SAM-dependent methyltransferase [Stellaceae bacterium]